LEAIIVLKAKLTVLCRQKLNGSSQQQMAANYFRSNRAEKLLQQQQQQQQYCELTERTFDIFIDVF
jgi:hypothetical protein